MKTGLSTKNWVEERPVASTPPCSPVALIYPQHFFRVIVCRAALGTAVVWDHPILWPNAWAFSVSVVFFKRYCMTLWNLF